MNRAEKFFYKTSILDENHCDILSHFKREIARASVDVQDNQSKTSFSLWCSVLVGELFGIPDFKKPLTDCFYRFCNEERPKEKFPRFKTDEIIETVGIKEYREMQRIFKNSEIKEKLEKVGFQRVGVVTFINMITYTIWKKSFDPN